MIKILQLESILFLLFFTSCKTDPREYYELVDIELDYFDLVKYQKSDSCYPLSYDEDRSNQFVLITLNYRFDFFDSTDMQCPLTPGCNGPHDKILEVFFPKELLQPSDPTDKTLLILDESSKLGTLPYNPNEIHKNTPANDTNNTYLKHISELEFQLLEYNLAIGNNNLGSQFLNWDEFFFIEKNNFQDYLNKHGKPLLLVETNLRSISSK